MSSSQSMDSLIHSRLTDSLAPTSLEVVNDSRRHAGHAGDDGTGETHYTVRIVSPVFEGRSRIDRQRMVHEALRAELASRIHALSIQARTPDEAATSR